MATIQEENERLHRIYYRALAGPESPYGCPRCGSTFKTSDERNEHVREHAKKSKE